VIRVVESGDETYVTGRFNRPNSSEEGVLAHRAACESLEAGGQRAREPGAVNASSSTRAGSHHVGRLHFANTTDSHCR
jgi:hypothetical protein